MKHLLPKELRSFRYYERKLPLWLRNDEAFVQHFRLWYELCMGLGDETNNIAIKEFSGIAPSSDLLLYLLNIYSDDFLSIVSELSDDTNSQFDLIDKLGELFGLKRTFSIDYYDSPSDVEKTHLTITLTDSEYITLIKAQIIRNYCNGSYEQILQYYVDANLEIIMINSDEYDASVNAYLNNNANLTDNIKALFKAGFLTVESLGIHYTYLISDILNTLLWADVNGQKSLKTWDEGVWAI